MRAWLAASLLCAAAPATASFVDPLDQEAAPSALAPRSQLNAVAAAGGRLVAVGQRGHVLFSDDGGAHWGQGAVPVSVDLTGVHLVSADRGWAVGHGGVVLATVDGGRSWRRQLDARSLGRLLGPERGDVALLDLWFDDARTGFVVGAFNVILRTDDGGETWTPWLDRTENPAGLHLHAIRRVAGELYVVGERGLVLRLDRAAGRFVAVPAPYRGSFFGVIGAGPALVVFGLRGHAYRSTDGGMRWEALRTGVDDTLTAATALPDGRLVLVTQAGDVLVEAGDGALRPAAARRALPTAGVAPAGPGALALVGAAGVRLEALP